MKARRLLYAGLVGVVAAQRLLELRTSARHEAELRARGGREHAPWQARCMRVVHTAWLGGALIEGGLLGGSRSPFTCLAGLGLFAAGQLLRRAAMRELGSRWSIKIITLPGAPAVATGIFGRMRHPNYLGVALEMAGLPLAGGAWMTAALASIANGALLLFRIRSEEAALRADSAYERLAARPRLLPRLKVAA